MVVTPIPAPPASTQAAAGVASLESAASTAVDKAAQHAANTVSHHALMYGAIALGTIAILIIGGLLIIHH